MTTLHETWGDHDIEAQHLHKAVKNNDFDAVEEITSKHPDIIDIADNHGFSSLMLASARGHIELMLHLLKNGADKDYASLSNKTPLMVACEKGQIEAAMELIKAGANVHVADKGGVPIIHHAVDSKQVLLIEELIKAGVDVDERDHGHGWTPLMRCAATFGDVHVARILVHFGADVNAEDDSHLTPLLLATNGGFHALVTFLLSAGADAQKANPHGVTPRRIAMSARRRDIVDIIERPPPDITSVGQEDSKRIDSTSDDS